MKKENGKLNTCPNCGTALKAGDNFCPTCGQKNHSLHVPFRHLLLEFAEGLVHFDSKSLKTVRALVLQPGRLTAEFGAGRRTRYVPPVRLYISVSFIFFFLISWNPHRPEAPEMTSGSNTRNKINLTFYSIRSDELEGLSQTQIDSLMEVRGIKQTGFNRYVLGQLGRIATGGKTEFNHMLLKGVSYMMFVLMPFFGLLLYLFYRKRAGYYLDCLVFSVHFHTFAFLAFAAYFVLGWFAPSLILLAATAVVLAVYLFLASKTVYCQNNALTMLKTLFIGGLHIASLAVCFLATTLVSVLLF